MAHVRPRTGGTLKVMTRKSLLATLAILTSISLLAPQAAEARPRPRRGKSFEANKSFGLGLELGAPAGLVGKYFLSSDRALQFGLGAYYHWRDRDGAHIYLDYLFHPVSLVSAESFELPLYFGVGGRLWNIDHYRGDYRDYNGTALGVRVPVGIAFDFNNVPLDIFIQVALTFDFLHFGFRDGYRDFYADFNGSFGIRYWF